ncbi:MAG: HDOD domain-containing protein, partial [Actinomycetota bacterium]
MDDEPNVLQGIKRATRNMRDVWAVSFVESGDAALAALAEQTFDVVVSDMRMPGMDGAELLSHIRSLQPGAARIMLSGYAEEEALFRSTRAAHRFLRKPCNVEELKQTIEDIRACRAMVAPEIIRDLVGRVDQLPVLGDVYLELTEAIERDTSDAESLGRIVSKDMALTAELLRLVNSAFFGLSRRVESVAQAIGLLGFDVVRAIVVGLALFSSDDHDAVDVSALAKRSQLTALLCRRVVQLEGGTPSECGNAYLAGILHQIGALVLANLPGTEPAEIRAVLDTNDPTIERLELGADRFLVAAYLLGLWAFAPAIVEAIGSLASQPAPEQEPDLLTRSLRVATDVLRDDGAIDRLLTGDQGDIDAAIETAADELDHRLQRKAPAPVEAA